MQIETWERFEKLLFDLSKKPGKKPARGEFCKDASPLISPTTYKKGVTRANVNVISWGRWAALDIDDYPNTMDDAIKCFEDYKYVCYSSASSTKEKPKFRIVLPLTEEVPQEKIRHFWFALNTEFNSLIDKQCKDLSRMYYVPAKYPNAYNFIFTNDGAVISPNELMSKHPFAASFKSSFNANFKAKIQEELLSYKKGKLDNTDISWTGIDDCPFFNKRWIAEYRAITESGWYAYCYKIMTMIAAKAIDKRYPIQPIEIASLIRELDMITGGLQKKRYGNRPFELEAARAIEWALKNV